MDYLYAACHTSNFGSENHFTNLNTFKICPSCIAFTVFLSELSDFIKPFCYNIFFCCGINLPLDCLYSYWILQTILTPTPQALMVNCWHFLKFIFLHSSQILSLLIKLYPLFMMVLLKQLWSRVHLFFHCTGVDGPGSVWILVSTV